MLIIGTDEAGYGPNLGPLVVAASAWDVPDRFAARDLYELLEEAVCRAPSDPRKRIAIADSKRLYKPGGSLAGLESTIHAALAMLDRPAPTWKTAFERLHVDTDGALDRAPWHEGYDEALPLDCEAAAIAATADKFFAALSAKGVALVELRVRIVFPAAFNQHVRRLGSKGALLTEQTLRLVDDVLGRCPASRAHVDCDKHGGRNRYAAALQHVWPESWINILSEAREQSEYTLAIRGSDARFRFSMGGETQLPCALASMTAKYLRELAMRAFNRFWARHVAELRPTAGYPTDAKRFKADIAATQRKLKIDDDVLWRCK